VKKNYIVICLEFYLFIFLLNKLGLEFSNSRLAGKLILEQGKLIVLCLAELFQVFLDARARSRVHRQLHVAYFLVNVFHEADDKVD
jgi:hypothetical protein